MESSASLYSSSSSSSTLSSGLSSGLENSFVSCKEIFSAASPPLEGKERSKSILKVALKSLKCIAYVFAGLIYGAAKGIALAPFYAVAFPAYTIAEAFRRGRRPSKLFKAAVIIGAPVIGVAAAVLGPALEVRDQVYTFYKKAMS